MLIANSEKVSYSSQSILSIYVAYVTNRKIDQAIDCVMKIILKKLAKYMSTVFISGLIKMVHISGNIH